MNSLGKLLCFEVSAVFNLVHKRGKKYGQTSCLQNFKTFYLIYKPLSAERIWELNSNETGFDFVFSTFSFSLKNYRLVLIRNAINLERLKTPPQITSSY